MNHSKKMIAIRTCLMTAAFFLSGCSQSNENDRGDPRAGRMLHDAIARCGERFRNEKGIVPVGKFTEAGQCSIAATNEYGPTAYGHLFPYYQKQANEFYAIAQDVDAQRMTPPVAFAKMQEIEEKTQYDIGKVARARNNPNSFNKRLSRALLTQDNSVCLQGESTLWSNGFQTHHCNVYGDGQYIYGGH